MKRWLEGFSFRKDFPSSIVVFLVALPLCMGIAIACGAPPAAGILSGIIGGLVVGALSGSPLQVSGPAAGLVVVVFEIVQGHGMAVLGMAIALAGVIQMTAGVLRLGQWFRAVPIAVIDGMLAAIGLLIVGSQFHVLLDQKPVGSGLTNLAHIPGAGLQVLSGSIPFWPALVGGLALVILFGWSRWMPARIAKIPAALIAVSTATLLVEIFALPVNRAVIPADFFGALHWMDFGALSTMDWYVVKAAVTIALVASAESLICAAAVDQIHTGPRTKFNQELFAQGAGNLAAGALGGLPITGVIVRSSVNVGAGAGSRASAMCHGFWLLLFVGFAPSLLQLIPTSCLAAILVFTGFKLMSPARAKELWARGYSEIAIYAVTVAAIVATDLLSGVLVGIAASLLFLLFRFAQFQIRVHRHPEPHTYVLHLEGRATFLGLPKLAAALDRVERGASAEFRVDDLHYIDHACWEMIAQWRRFHESTDGRIEADWDRLKAKLPSAR